jgi:hypothetical protein
MRRERLRCFDGLDEKDDEIYEIERDSGLWSMEYGLWIELSEC